MGKVALGKGLGALITARNAVAATAPQDGEVVQKVALSQIIPSPLQPRKDFPAEGLGELIESVRERGIIQPLIVRKIGSNYELIAGERRWRAATEVGLKEAPVIVRDASDLEVLELALIENLQREDLNAIEEAQAYARLAREFSLKQEEISKKVGKSRATVANSMRLLDLHPDVQKYVVHDRLSVGHAKVLLSVKDATDQVFLAELILKQGATVRVAEKLVSAHLERVNGTRPTRSKSKKTSTELAPALQHVQNRLRERLATHVTIQHSEKKGHLAIEYYGNDDLQRILELLGVETVEK